MITRRYQEILKNVNTYLDENYRTLNIDLLTIFNYVIVHYSRNVFHYNDDWKKIQQIYDFDYEYINETNCTDDLLQIEREYRKFGKLFKNNKNITDIEDYKKFIEESFYLMINKIIIPIRHKVGKLDPLIKKYEQKYPKKQRKSDKINYEALHKLIEEKMISV